MDDITRTYTHSLQRANFIGAITSLENTIDAIIKNQIEAEYDNLNAYHNDLRSLEQQLADFDSAWERRNWTAGDYATHALIAQNID